MEVVGAIIVPHPFRVLAGALSPLILAEELVKQAGSCYYPQLQMRERAWRPVHAIYIFRVFFFLSYFPAERIETRNALLRDSYLTTMP